MSSALSINPIRLLHDRPNPIRSVKILSELRPVYSEDATSVKAFVLAKTLAVDYVVGETDKTIFLSMDMDDLRDILGIEVKRPKLKTETISDEAVSWGVDLLVTAKRGDEDACGAEETRKTTLLDWIDTREH